MKHLLLTTIAAVLLVGCGPSAPDIDIHSAAVNGNIEAVKQHLAAGTDVNAKGGVDGGTPLYSAVIPSPNVVDHKQMVELLIAEGADVNANAKDENGWTPLVYAKFVYKRESPDAKAAGETAELLRKHGNETPPTHNNRSLGWGSSLTA